MLKERLFLIGTHSLDNSFYAMSDSVGKILEDKCKSQDSVRCIYLELVRSNAINITDAIINGIENKYVNLLHEDPIFGEQKLDLFKYVVISTVSLMMPNMELPIPIYEKLLKVFTIKELVDSDEIENIFQDFNELASMILPLTNNYDESIDWFKVFKSVATHVAQFVNNIK